MQDGGVISITAEFGWNLTHLASYRAEHVTSDATIVEWMSRR
jgi:hypothetical protein